MGQSFSHCLPQSVWLTQITAQLSHFSLVQWSHTHGLHYQTETKPPIRPARITESNNETGRITESNNETGLKKTRLVGAGGGEQGFCFNHFFSLFLTRSLVSLF